jgi:hypothetical protein
MLPFCTASEAAEQARPKYLAPQLAKINEAVKLAIANGRYQTIVRVETPADYTAEEDPHRNAAIQAAFPEHKVTVKIDASNYHECFEVRISWIPKTPLPLVAPPVAEKKPASEPSRIALVAALVVAVIEWECNENKSEDGSGSLSNTLPFPSVDLTTSSALVKEIRTHLEGRGKYKNISIRILSNPNQREEIYYNVSW